MPLETATYIPELVTSNPAASDGMNNADDHMRLIKAAIKNTLPNFTAAALTSTQAQIDAAVAAMVTGTAAGRFYAGTSLLPGLTPVGDPNTGLWAAGADSLTVVTNGVARYNVDASGNHTFAGPVSVSSLSSSGAYSGGTGQLVPVGATLLWWDDVLPTEGGYAWANGQIISSANTVCPVLLARWGSRFGGNGITTMGVPDLRDTVPVGKSTMGGAASRALHTLTNTVLGTLIGAANVVLTTLNLPAYTPSGTITNGAITFPSAKNTSAANGSQAAIATGVAGGTGDFTTLLNPVQATSTIAFNAQGGTSTPVNNVQPSTTCNYIIRLA